MISNLRIPLLLLSGAIVTGFIAGIITLLRIPENPCEMTYMFEHPQYIPGRADPHIIFSSPLLYFLPFFHSFLLSPTSLFPSFVYLRISLSLYTHILFIIFSLSIPLQFWYLSPRHIGINCTRMVRVDTPRP